MNEQFNFKLQEWLNNDQRTTDEGCLLLLQMEGNRIHYDNLMRFPDKDKLMKYLISELTRRLKARLAKVTHEQVEEMSKKAEVIVSEHFAFEEKTTNEEFRKGKRFDHDSLPEEIQARYVENLSLLQRMREVHLKLRSLSTEQVSCPDSERYPFLKELIDLDKQLHENWEVYDHYVLPSPTPATATVSGDSQPVPDDSVAEKTSVEEQPIEKQPIEKQPVTESPTAAKASSATKGKKAKAKK